ncbi:MAG: hypothetical protein JRI46_01100 [Deltaproteobacteria bacterium]|nr:hypothetical protein [Deltaproteobacteria bacterium]
MTAQAPLGVLAEGRGKAEGVEWAGVEWVALGQGLDQQESVFAPNVVPRPLTKLGSPATR